VERFSRERSAPLLFVKMGRLAYSQGPGRRLASFSLGDAHRGTRYLATPVAVSNLEEPAAPTPPSGGPFQFS
jgi:hypothetical protein